VKPLRVRRLARQIGGLFPYAFVATLFGAVVALHYLTPQMRRLYLPLDVFLSRHAVERIAFLIPIALATAYFQRRGGSIVLLLAIAAMLPRVFWVSPYPMDALLETVITAVVGGLVVGVVDAQTRAKEIRQRLADTMRSYSHQISRAQERERERLSRELHDETIQMLIVLSRRLEALATLPESLPPAAVERVSTLQNLVSDTLRNLRRLVRDLRPPALDHLGLAAASAAMVNGISDELGIEVSVQVSGEKTRPPADQELALLRILQEALNNIRRHARASHVQVRLAFEPDATRLTIQDDGCGFSGVPSMEDLVSAGQLGLVGMRERAEALGGTLVIRANPGQGTTITAEIPREYVPSVPQERAHR